MTRFLHLADIHLGIRRYRSDERTRDYFLAWKDCIEKYALKERVSFVLIAGDFFDSRRVEPQAMNQAMEGLGLLQAAGIPVLAIEGNHDQHEVTNRFSWLRSLSHWGFIKLLEPVYIDGRAQYQSWDETRRSGSFVDIEGVRVFGSNWYGATTAQMVPVLIDELRRHRNDQRFNVLMMHTDVEGQLNRPIPAISVARLSELKEVTDYLALGHTHKNFEIGGWIFNPGSLEACNVDEYEYRRGAYLVDIVNGKANARLVEDYYRRPVLRFQFSVEDLATPEEVRQNLFAKLRSEIVPFDPNQTAEPAPVIEVVLYGRLDFPPSLLDVNRVRDEIRKEFCPLLALVRDQTIPNDYAIAVGLRRDIPRAERELRVIEDLVKRDARFRDRSAEMAGLIVEAKRLALVDEDPARIADLIAQRLEILPQSGSVV